jgi:DME family drug/metabolite transporter
MALRGYVFVLLAAVCWGITGPFAKLAFSQGVQPLEVAFWRCVLGFAPFTIQALLHPDRSSLRLARRDRGPMLAFALLCVAGFYAVYQLAIQSGGAALACVLMYTAPAFVALMAWLVLGERMTPAKLAAVAATLAGVAAVSGLFSGGGSLAVGPAALAYGLLSGFTYALYYIFGKRFLSRYRTPVIFMYALPVGGLVLWPLTTFTAKTPLAWLAILVCGLVATYAAYSLYYAGLRHMEATRAAVVATLEPVVAAILAFAWWGESFSGPAWLGSGLILGAVGLTLWDGRRNSAAALRRAQGAELTP